MTAGKRIWIFIAITFGLTWGLILLMYLCGAAGSPLYSMSLSLCMMFPALGSILTRAITREGFKDMLLRPNFKGNWGKYVMAALMPLAFIATGAVLYYLIFPGEFDITGAAMSSALAASGVPAEAAKTVMLVQAVTGVLLGPFVNLVFTFGEELGWRAYLLPRLNRSMSARAAVLVSGVIWGVWHAPMIALGHNYGMGYAGWPYLGILAMILFCVTLGCFESWLTFKVKSVWPAAMVHSAVNALAALPAYFNTGSANTLLGPALTGVVGGGTLLIAAVLFFILYRGKGLQKGPDQQSEAQ